MNHGAPNTREAVSVYLFICFFFNFFVYFHLLSFLGGGGGGGGGDGEKYNTNAIFFIHQAATDKPCALV